MLDPLPPSFFAQFCVCYPVMKSDVLYYCKYHGISDRSLHAAERTFFRVVA